MALRRVFVERIEDGEALATGRMAHHLARVARLRPGERVEVSNQLTAYTAVTATCTPAEVRFRIEAPLPDPVPTPVVDAALSIIKFPRFEWAIEKLTELGVHSIVPIVAARSDPALCASATRRLARWRRIAFEAAQQSRRLAAPFVRGPVRFDEFVRTCGAGSRILAQPGGPQVASTGPDGSTSILVGPEGGWTDAELQLAGEGGFEPAGLGSTVLRAETAAIAFAAICASRPAVETEE